MSSMSSMSKKVGIIGVLFVAGASLAASFARAQTPPSFGVDPVSTYLVTAWELQPADSAVQWTSGDNGHRSLTAGVGLLGTVHLPQGARVLSIDLEACDASAAGEVVATLYRQSASAPSELIATVNTGDVPAPGCSQFLGSIPVPDVVDNATYRYLIVANNTTYDGTTSLASLRVYYSLQVSPAPFTATFNDVPTSDPAFQFIEALVASGVTAGCGGGNYCPDAALTRRQMAVFLAKLLGLQWPDGPAL